MQATTHLFGCTRTRTFNSTCELCVRRVCSQRVADMPELGQLRALFASKYGKEYAAEASSDVTCSKWQVRTALCVWHVPVWLTVPLCNCSVCICGRCAAGGTGVMRTPCCVPCER